MTVAMQDAAVRDAAVRLLGKPYELLFLIAYNLTHAPKTVGEAFNLVQVTRYPSRPAPLFHCVCYGCGQTVGEILGIHTVTKLRALDKKRTKHLKRCPEIARYVQQYIDNTITNVNERRAT